MSTYLERVSGPADLKNLSRRELDDLAAEIRGRIIETVSKTGGHLAANLGAVELTLALLRVFDPPSDKIVWDVGHQTYAYKILTGRRDRFGTLRQYGGISGFLKRAESEYDVFGAGHSGTAISAALGIACARDRRGSGEHVVAVLGDAAAGNGISLEALNNVVGSTERLIVVLNDNEMSIAANVGALSRYLGYLLANPRYNRWKKSVESIATRMHLGWLRKAYYRTEEAIKSLFLGSVIFEELGLRYIGPIDGHNLDALFDAMRIARESTQPILLHVSTTKGKGYSFAEELPEKWHGTSGFDIVSGKSASKTDKVTYSEVFGATLVKLAEQDETITAITAAMPAGTGLTEFARRYPDRFFDVGISEEHGAVFAAGLASEGSRPVFAVYSTFLQRAVDCVIHDVCLQNLPVVFCLDRAGVVGDDGPTHHGVFDLALLRPVPKLTIMQPRDERELASMLYTALKMERPSVIRYPRGSGAGSSLPTEFEEIPLGKAEVLRPGREIQIWALGDMVAIAEKVVEYLADAPWRIGIVNPRFVKPLDAARLAEQAASASLMVTIENGVVSGGFGTGVIECLSERGLHTPVLRLGWPDEFIPHGKVDLLFEQFGLRAEQIAKTVRAEMQRIAAPE